MKRWLKKHGKWVAVGVGVLFIGNAGYGICVADAEWKVVANIFVITIWLTLILFVSGAIPKILEWWEKD